MDDKIWLVKSSYKVLGPYTHEEVCEHLKSKKISILDEVRSPETRWISARERSEFIDFIKLLKNQENYSDATMTQTSTERHSQLTKTDQIPFKDELTPTPYLSSTQPNVNIQDIDVLSETNRSEVSSSSSLKSFGSMSDEKIQKKIQKDSLNFRWLLMIFMGVLVVGYAGFLVTKSSMEAREYSRNLNEALKLKDQKLYSQSLAIYDQVMNQKIPDNETQFKMSFLNLAIRGGSAELRRLFDVMINSPELGSVRIKEASLARALSYMYDGDFKRSIVELDKLLTLDLNFTEAKLNQAIASFYDGKFRNAYQTFQADESIPDYKIIRNYGKLLSSIELTKSGIPTYPAIENSNSKYLSRSIMLLEAYSSYLKSDFKKMDEQVQLFLDQPMELSQKFAHPLEIFWKFFDPEILNKYCKELAGFGGEKTMYITLKSQCIFESENHQRAEEELTNGLLKFPEDQNLKLTQVQFLMSRKQNSNANVLLDSISRPSTLKNQLKKEICLRLNDTQCLGNIIGIPTVSFEKNTYDSYFLANYLLRSNKRTQAYEVTERALELENNFIPLLQLRSEMEAH